MKILGLRVDEVDRDEAIKRICRWAESGRGGSKQVVTIYSEFFLRAGYDKKFLKALQRSELVVPDGVGVLAAMEYLEDPSLFKGLRLGVKGLSGGLGQPVTGVWLFEELVRLASRQGLKVFLLGGFGNTVEKLARRLRKENNGLKLEFDAGERSVGDDRAGNKRVIEKINGFKPDLLFVAYGPGKQEKWIYENKRRLKAKVAMGVGGTFDEVLGRFPKTPKWMEKRGLKALYRLVVDPKRLPRIWRAMVVFPLRVYTEGRKKK
jgi:N-acetylglucosaminyldiphosphoundecaprenol N-acetyl-beta-D-mannosaminyltransferase